MSSYRTTELLCKLLEERGVSCQTHYLHASWCIGPKLYEAVDNLDGTLTVNSLTPEQAVTVTLGGGKLTAEQVREAIFNGSGYASYDGAKYYADGISMQAIADELNAKLNTQAERTCKVAACYDHWEPSKSDCLIRLLEGYEGARDKSRYSELFGTPERAARTLSEAKGLCNWCDMESCAGDGGECRIYDYDSLLEWLRGDAE